MFGRLFCIFALILFHMCSSVVLANDISREIISGRVNSKIYPMSHIMMRAKFASSTEQSIEDVKRKAQEAVSKAEKALKDSEKEWTNANETIARIETTLQKVTESAQKVSDLLEEGTEDKKYAEGNVTSAEKSLKQARTYAGYIGEDVLSIKNYKADVDAAYKKVSNSGTSEEDKRTEGRKAHSQALQTETKLDSIKASAQDVVSEEEKINATLRAVEEILRKANEKVTKSAPAETELQEATVSSSDESGITQSDDLSVTQISDEKSTVANTVTQTTVTSNSNPVQRDDESEQKSSLSSMGASTSKAGNPEEDDKIPSGDVKESEQHQNSIGTNKDTKQKTNVVSGKSLKSEVQQEESNGQTNITKEKQSELRNEERTRDETKLQEMNKAKEVNGNDNSTKNDRDASGIGTNVKNFFNPNNKTEITLDGSEAHLWKSSPFLFLLLLASFFLINS